MTQLSYQAHLKEQQEGQLENWLLRFDRAVRIQMSNKQCDFVTKYMTDYWRKNVKGIDVESEFVAQLPPLIRKKVPPHNSNIW